MKLNNKGTTLVEVIAGFVLLVVLMTSFMKIIDLSSELTSTAIDTRNDSINFKKAYYNGYNYQVNGKNAFVSSKVALNVSITEWEKDLSTGEFKEFHKNANGKYELFINNNASLYNKNLEKSSVIKLDSINDTSMTRMTLFRYKTEK